MCMITLFVKFLYINKSIMKIPIWIKSLRAKQLAFTERLRMSSRRDFQNIYQYNISAISKSLLDENQKSKFKLFIYLIPFI